ncbi:MAG: GntR family transcriptional regulator [Acetobacteraceae bacterium]|nr:GntR family transcriptional regulator [Acetobacteraceae bacterium]
MATRVPLTRTRLSDAVYEKLREQIVRTALPPGSRIAESEFAEQLGVSRTPVREALLRLADEGLVEMFPQSGIYVTPIRRAAVSEAQFIREHLECAVIREAASRIDAAGIASLRATLVLQELAQSARDLDGFYGLDERLHEQFSQIAGRDGIWRMIKHSKPHLDRVRWLSLPVAEQVPHLIRQHRTVVDAVAQHDPDIAAAALRVHLREVYRTIEQLGIRDDGNEN